MFNELLAALEMFWLRSLNVRTRSINQNSGTNSNVDEWNVIKGEQMRINLLFNLSLSLSLSAEADCNHPIYGSKKKEIIGELYGTDSIVIFQ